MTGVAVRSLGGSLGVTEVVDNIGDVKFNRDYMTIHVPLYSTHLSVEQSSKIYDELLKEGLRMRIEFDPFRVSIFR